MSSPLVAATRLAIWATVNPSGITKLTGGQYGAPSRTSMTSLASIAESTW